MIVAACLVPATALLVPGAAGRAEVLVDLRARALDAVSALLAAQPEEVVVIAPGPTDRSLRGPVRATLASVGVPDDRLGWTLPASQPAQVGAPAVGVAASVGLLLLARSGWSGPVSVVEVAPPDPEAVAGATTGRAAHLRALGAQLADLGAGAGSGPGMRPGAGRVGLLVVGSLSARHGPDAPLADDERAPAYDAAVLVDLADGSHAAQERLGSLDEGVAGELAVTGWSPWQVLLGAVGGEAVDAVVLAAGAPFGAQQVVATWLPRAARAVVGS